MIFEKACRVCERTLPLSDFHRSKEGRLGRQARCKACNIETYGIGSPQFNEARRDHRRSNWATHAINGCRERAKKLGVPFDLSIADITVPEICPVLRIPLFLTPGKKTPNSPSVDRMIPSKGYVRGNVVVISWRANRLKLNETDPSVFEALADYLLLNRALWTLAEEMAKLKTAA